MSELAIHDNLADEALQGEWRRAYAGADLPVFQSLEWARLWCKHYTDFDSLQVLWERRGDGSSFILPMMERAGQLRSLTYNASDYTGSVFLPHSRQQPARIAQWLAERARVLPVVLWNVRRADPVVRLLDERDRLQWGAADAVALLDLNVLRPDGGGWLRSSSTRRQAFEDGKRLLRLGARFDFTTVPTGALFEQMVDLHTRNWRARGQTGKFADARRVAFVRDLLLGQCGIPTSLATLTLGSELVAYNLGFLDGTRFALWNSGYHPDYANLGPGTALLTRQILHLAATFSLSTYDFLRGRERYKQSFSTSEEWVHTCQVRA